jgi:hypothetical protein
MFSRINGAAVAKHQQAAQKELRGEAREKSPSGGIL